LPVRSALFKQRTGGLVVRWVTTGESPLLYVFFACMVLWPESRQLAHLASLTHSTRVLSLFDAANLAGP
ncbi:hypothetical protein EJ07DRAFT_95129, partial [Lizonia empirigonia]